MKQEFCTWEGTVIKSGKDPRVELRRKFIGKKSSTDWPTSAEALIVVRPNTDTIVLSANGSLSLKATDLTNIMYAIDLAVQALKPYYQPQDLYPKDGNEYF